MCSGQRVWPRRGYVFCEVVVVLVGVVVVVVGFVGGGHRVQGCCVVLLSGGDIAFFRGVGVFCGFE